MVSPRSVVPAGMTVAIPMPFSLAVGPANSAVSAAFAGACVTGIDRWAVAMNGPVSGCVPPIERMK